MTFSNNAPASPADWISAGRRVVPCKDKNPRIKDWSNPEKNIPAKEVRPDDNTGLILDQDTDLDVDNPKCEKFIPKYLKSNGAVYGRKSNPESHYLFNDSIEPRRFTFPKELESYYRGFPHGSCIAEIRHGNGYQSIVPGSSINNEKVEWHKFANINKYDGDLADDISKIALSTALSILYPPKGNRDNYCTAIAGVLSEHTDKTSSEIDEFVYTLAVASNDNEPAKRMSKGTNAKNAKGNKLGIPTIAEIVGCTNSTIGKLFEWVGCKDNGSLFTDLKCYMTIPKYWELKFKAHVLRIMDTAVLMSYAKMQTLIEEHCFEVAPVITPKEWRQIRTDLYRNVEKIDVPFEQSFFGVIANHFSSFCINNQTTDKRFLFDKNIQGCWHDQPNKRYVFKLESFTDRLRARRISFEQRALTAMLREKFGAETGKITLNKKELRIWSMPMANIQKFENTDDHTFMEDWEQNHKPKFYKPPDVF